MIDTSDNPSTSSSPLQIENGGWFVDNVIADPQQPVTLFSLSWCSYCRGAKQLLTELGIPFRVFELDKGEFLEPRLHGEIRGRLQSLTRSTTLPQLFIGGENVGGYTEVFGASRSGSLGALLEKHNVAIHTN